MAEAAPIMDEAFAALEEIVSAQFSELLESAPNHDGACVFCGAEAYFAWDEDAGGNRFADWEFCSITHEEGCPIGKAVGVMERHRHLAATETIGTPTEPKFYICRDEGRDPEMATECTDLVAALADLCRFWGRDNHFSVEVMRAVGAVVAAGNAVLEVE